MEAIPHAAVAALISAGKLEREAKNVLSQLARAIMTEAKSHRETCHINLVGVGAETQALVVSLATEQGYQAEVKSLGGSLHLFLFWGAAKGTEVKDDAQQEAAAAERAAEVPPAEVVVTRKPPVLSEEERQRRRDRMAAARAKKGKGKAQGPEAQEEAPEQEADLPVEEA